MPKYDPIKAGILESLGCFALMFFGTFKTNVINPLEDKNELAGEQILENSIAHLFIYMVMMWLAVQHSGAQFNPLLTLSMLVAGELPWLIAVVNVLAQIAGAFLGFFALQNLCKVDDTYLNYKNVGRVNAMFFELLPSFMLTMAFLMTMVHKTSDRGVYAIAVPGVYAVFTLAIGRYFYTRYNLLLLAVTSVLKTGFEPNFGFVALGAVIGAVTATAIYMLLFKNQPKKEQMMPLADEDNEIKF